MINDNQAFTASHTHNLDCPFSCIPDRNFHESERGKEMLS